jgi:hypothetical protein
MAERIKFRLTAAKVGVSVAFLALVGGLVDKLHSGRPEVRVTPASAPGQFLKLQGLSHTVKIDFLKLEQKWVKIDSLLTNVVHKLNTQFLKIEDANTEFLKIKLADAKFLKIVDANAEYLKIDAANAEYLKIRSANAQFLKIRAAQDQFLQGHGGVVSAASPVLADGSVTKLISSPDGGLVVTLRLQDGEMTLFIDNTTGALIPAVQTTDNLAPQPINLEPGNRNSIRLGPDTQVHQVHLQTFGDGSANEVTTLVLSTDLPQAGANGPQVVAQMLIGLL